MDAGARGVVRVAAGICLIGNRQGNPLDRPLHSRVLFEIHAEERAARRAQTFVHVPLVSLIVEDRAYAAQKYRENIILYVRCALRK